MQIKFMDEGVASEAAAFYEVGKEIDNKVNKYVDSLKHGEVPSKREMIKQITAMVNMAFSCELFLKSRIEKEEREKRENQIHNIETLLKKQELDFQQWIKKEVVEIMKREIIDYDEARFDTDLKNNSEVFFKWRYYYEGKSLVLNAQFIRALSFVLYYLYETQLQIIANDYIENNK